MPVPDYQHEQSGPYCHSILWAVFVFPSYSTHVECLKKKKKSLVFSGKLKLILFLQEAVNGGLNMLVLWRRL